MKFQPKLEIKYGCLADVVGVSPTTSEGRGDVPVQTQVQADSALQSLSHAACKGGSSKGRLCEDVAQQRGFSIDSGCTAKEQGEETCSKGTGSRKGEQGRPTGGEGRNAGTAGGSRGGVGVWVGALLGFARDCECSAGSATCGPAGGSGRSSGRDQTSVNCKLRAPPERKPFSNDFNAALILPGSINIEVSSPYVEGNGGSGLSVDAGSSALKAQGARPWHEGRLTEDMLRGGRRKGHAVAGSGYALPSRAGAGGAGGGATRGRTASRAEGPLRRDRSGGECTGGMRARLRVQHS